MTSGGSNAVDSRVFMFPGQSSADPGMLARAQSLDPAAREIATTARIVLGDSLADRYLDSSVAPLETNRDIQIAVFLATQMHLAALRARGIDAEDSVGLSLGEYSHLVHIGALSFADALRLVMVRGALYDRSPAGVMVTVIGPDEDTVSEVVSQASPRGPVVISNFNTPTQHVLAGDAATVTWAAEQLEEEHGAMAVVIERRVPMHSPLMADTAQEFRTALEGAPWGTPTRSYWPNVLGRRAVPCTTADFPALLTAHVWQPVLWRRTIEQLALARPDATFVEVGPGHILRHMLGRRWIAPRCACTDAPNDPAPAEHFRAIVDTLRAGR